MREPREPRSPADAIQIGKILEKLANEQISRADAKKQIVSRFHRQDYDNSNNEVVFVYEESPNQKKIIVPDPAMLENAKTRASAGEYTLMEPYLIMVARQLKKYSEANGLDLAQHVRDMAAEEMSNEDFFYFRFGEYSINECK